MKYLINGTINKSRLLDDIPFDINGLTYDYQKHTTNILRKFNVKLDTSKTLMAKDLYKGAPFALLEDKFNNNQIMILSSLFGWLSPYDRIPLYDLKMTPELSDYWYSTGVLRSGIIFTDIHLLSIPYLKAVYSKDRYKHHLSTHSHRFDIINNMI